MERFQVLVLGSCTIPFPTISFISTMYWLSARQVCGGQVKTRETEPCFGKPGLGRQVPCRGHFTPGIRRTHERAVSQKMGAGVCQGLGGQG